MRKFLNFIYTASGWLAGIGMIGVLVCVTIMIVGRIFGFPIGGFDSYAGYSMAGAGFLALANTLKHGEHIRVTLILNALHGRKQHYLELFSLLVAVIISGFLAYYSIHLVLQSYQFQIISVGIDATPVWIPQIFMAIGTIIFFIAFLDEFTLELMGKRPQHNSENLHHE